MSLGNSSQPPQQEWGVPPCGMAAPRALLPGISPPAPWIFLLSPHLGRLGSDLISFLYQKRVFFLFPAGAQSKEGLQVPPLLPSLGRGWGEKGIFGIFQEIGVGATRGFIPPFGDGVCKIMAGGRRKVLEPFLGGLDPQEPPGPGQALGRPWGQECSQQDFLSSWTLLGFFF